MIVQVFLPPSVRLRSLFAKSSGTFHVDSTWDLFAATPLSLERIFQLFVAECLNALFATGNSPLC